MKTLIISTFLVASLLTTSVVFQKASANSMRSKVFAGFKYKAYKVVPPKVIKIRPRPVEKKPPNVVEIAQEKRVASSIAALKVSDNTARSQLRRALSNGPGVKLGTKWNAHHLLYWSQRNHPTVLKAARGGFNINGSQNGLRIPAATHKKVHSGKKTEEKISVNQSNILEINRVLDQIGRHKSLTPKQTATLLENHIRLWKYDIINKNPVIADFNKVAVVKGSANTIKLHKPLTTQ